MTVWTIDIVRLEDGGGMAMSLSCGALLLRLFRRR